MSTELDTTISAPQDTTPAFGEMSFEDALRAVVTKRQERTGPDVAEGPVAPPPKEEKPAVVAKEAPPPEESTAARIQRILDRERQISEVEAKFTSWETEKKELQAKAAALETAKEQFRRNPREFIRSLDPDFKAIDLANELFTEELGDNAPPEFKAKVQERRIQQQVEQRTTEIEKKFEARFAQLEEMERAARLNAYTANVQSALVAAPPDMELVARFAKSSPDKATAAAVRIAERAAAQGKLLSPAEVVTQLNAELTALRSIFVTEPAAPAAAPTSTTTEPTTLRNSNTQTVASKLDDSDETQFWAAVEAARKVRTALNT